jgi:hypothetical protein
MIARHATSRRCTRPRFLPHTAAHAACVELDGQAADYRWDDAPVSAIEFLREFVAGALLLGGGIVIAWMLLR